MLRVAIIGFGFMGMTHAANIQRNKRLTLQAIITRHPEAVESKLSGQTGNFSSGEIDVEALKRVPRYTSLQECHRHQRLDAVHICVHTDLHYALAMEAMDFLAKVGVEARPFFWPMHEQPVFKKMGLFKDEHYPVAEYLARNGFYIPSGTGITDQQVEIVADKVKELSDFVNE